jgi:hypothetical protein
MISNFKNNDCKICVARFNSKQLYVSSTKRICVSRMTFVINSKFFLLNNTNGFIFAMKTHFLFFEVDNELLNIISLISGSKMLSHQKLC